MFFRATLFALAFGASFTVNAPSANAVVADVHQIVISSTNDTWLQVSEVVARDRNGVDRALTTTATASGSAWRRGADGNDPDKAIDGIFPARHPNIYHSRTRNVSETLTIDFNRSFTLYDLSIFGRLAGNAGVRGRDIYDVELFDSKGVSLFSALGQSANNSLRQAVIALPTAEVPLPGGLSLMLAALGGLGFWRRFARQR